jgi:pantoate--beta-alanine ligase
VKICHTIDEIRQVSRGLKKEGKKIALVPTMGYLHEGHLSLIRKANNRADYVVVSIFVNPAQFGPKEDFKEYPRDFDRDKTICEDAHVDAIFYPSTEEMYPKGYSTFVQLYGNISEGLCGAKRPGHFRGVATIVAKLFMAVEPDLAVFGQKDAQQAAIIKRMTRELNFPVEIVISPIVREEDGLALSSRNKYLNEEERKTAPSIKKALDIASEAYNKGERSSAKLKDLVISALSHSALVKVDYVEIVDCEALKPVEKISFTPSLLALAVFVGKTRLIDNVVLGAKNGN